MYSEKGLSDPMDKSSALSSIAAYYSKLNPGDQYFAGLWLRDFTQQLCWRPRYGRKSTRPVVWRAPSWSYLSIDGPIQFVELHIHGLGSTRGEKGPGIRRLSVQATPLSHHAPFGKLASASAKIRGHVIEICRKNGEELNNSGSTYYDTEGTVTIRDNLDEYDSIGSSSYCTENHVTNYGNLDGDESIYYLVVTATQRTQARGMMPPLRYLVPWGLVLARLPDGTYHRVGTFDGEKENSNVSFSSFKQRKTQIITIV